MTIRTVVEKIIKENYFPHEWGYMDEFKDKLIQALEAEVKKEVLGVSSVGGLSKREMEMQQFVLSRLIGTKEAKT